MVVEILSGGGAAAAAAGKIETDVATRLTERRLAAASR